jgi:VWFA-related protein
MRWLPSCASVNGVRTGIAAGVALLSLCLAAGALLAAQQQAPETPQARFRARTDLVQIDVSVLDGDRHPVRGLAAADFTIFQDGQPQPIEAFTEVRLPDRIVAAAAPWTREVAPDVATNLIAGQEGRLVIILLDRSIPVGQPAIAARRIATAAVDQLGPGDLAAIVSTAAGPLQNLTAEKGRLRRAIDRSDPSAGVSSDSRELEEQMGTASGLSSALMTWTPLNDGRCNCGLCVLESLTRIGDALQDVARRRKVLLFIGSDLVLQSGGGPGSARTDVGCESRLRDTRTAMFASIGRANLTIHSLDPSGLQVGGPIAQASSPLRGAQVAAVAARDRIENLQRQDTLRVLPDRTGGRTVVNTNAPEERVPEIFRESDGYYLLAFRQTDTGPGKSHRVTVKVGRGGVSVHTRSGHFDVADPDAGPRGPAASLLPDTLRSVLTGLLPSGEVALDAHAAAFASPGSGRGTIALIVGMGAFASRSGEANEPFEIVASAFDQAGRSRGLARQTVDVSRPAREAAASGRLEVLSRLDLPPGDYQVRIGVTGGNPERNASVFSDVTVPDFDAAPLSLSSLVLAATAGTVTMPWDFLAPLLPVLPTARRDFAGADRLTAFVRVYQGSRRRSPLAAVGLRTTLVDTQGRDVAGASASLGADQFGSGREADHYISFPLSALAPGDYLLRLEATMGAFSAGRVLRFTVH